MRLFEPIIQRRRPAILALALAGLVWASPLRADLGGRLTVVAHALAARSGMGREPLALGALQPGDGRSSQRLGQALEGALRRALDADRRLILRPASANPEGADMVLDGVYRSRAAGLSLTLSLHRADGGPDRWTRTLWIPNQDLPAVDEGAAIQAGGDGEPLASGDEGLLVPTLPARARRVGRPFHWDLSVAYQAFFPLNSTFQGVVGQRLDGLSWGMSFQDIFLADFSSWHVDLNGPGSLQALDYYGMDLGLVAPWHLGPLTLYAGPGARIAVIEATDSQLDAGSLGFGNNGFLAVAGVKLKAGPVGLDLRYNYDLASSYTGYHTVRLGAFYEFGD